MRMLPSRTRPWARRDRAGSAPSQLSMSWPLRLDLRCSSERGACHGLFSRFRGQWGLYVRWQSLYESKDYDRFSMLTCFPLFQAPRVGISISFNPLQSTSCTLVLVPALRTRPREWDDIHRLCTFLLLLMIGSGGGSILPNFPLSEISTL